jgi:uncharacterized protein YkwD
MGADRRSRGQRQARPGVESLDGRVLLSPLSAVAGDRLRRIPVGVVAPAALRLRPGLGIPDRIAIPEFGTPLARPQRPPAPGPRLPRLALASLEGGGRDRAVAESDEPGPGGGRARMRQGLRGLAPRPGVSRPRQLAVAPVSTVSTVPEDPARFVARVARGAEAEAAAAILELANHLRLQNGRAALTTRPELMRAAQLHSDDMARLDRMLHDIPGIPLATLPDRAKVVGYRYQILGENIAYNLADPASLVAAWMGSPAHRDNLLDPRFVDAGLGIGWNLKGQPYYTLMLGKPA